MVAPEGMPVPVMAFPITIPAMVGTCVITALPITVLPMGETVVVAVAAVDIVTVETPIDVMVVPAGILVFVRVCPTTSPVKAEVGVSELLPATMYALME